MEAEVEVSIKRAIRSLEEIERCGCYQDGSLDPKHKRSVTHALLDLRRVEPKTRVVADGTKGMTRGI